MASGARLPAIRTARRTADCASNPSPWVTHDTDDLVRAVRDAITEDMRGNRFAAITMRTSDSSPGFTGSCDAASPAMTAGARDAARRGIAVASTAGNAARSNQIHWPGCISHVIAVGAANRCSNKSERVRWFSNLGPGLDLPAPEPGGTTTAETRSGSWQAAPHVAGAIALLRAVRCPGESLYRIRQSPACTGTRIGRVDGALLASNTRARPRIDVGAALLWQANPTAVACWTRTELGSAPQPSRAGARVTLTATVTAATGQHGGSVEFLDDATSLGRARRIAVEGPGIVAVSAGHEHSCGVSPNHEVWCLGSSQLAQPGNGSAADDTVPTGLTDATPVVGGDFHSRDLRMSGGVVCWGFGIQGTWETVAWR